MSDYLSSKGILSIYIPSGGDGSLFKIGAEVPFQGNEYTVVDILFDDRARHGAVQLLLKPIEKEATEKMIGPDAKILQIIPATFWRAVHEVEVNKTIDPSGRKQVSDHIVCWALVDFGDGKQGVIGMVSIDGVLDFCVNTKNFSHYEYSAYVSTPV